MKPSRLLLVTRSFPFGDWADFLDEEIWALAEAFDEIMVVPMSPRGQRTALPGNVQVDNLLCSRLSRAQRLRSLLSLPVLMFAAREVRQNWRQMWRPRQLARALLSVGGAASVSSWYREMVAHRPPPSVVYTFWLTEVALGIRQEDPTVPIISRIHRGDLFAEFQPGNYIPQHRASLESCTAVASVSESGRAYLAERYPSIADRLSVKRLGIKRFPRSAPSKDHAIRVVTCSTLKDVKRPLLAGAAIIHLARERHVIWHHFGDGPRRADLERLVNQSIASGADQIEGRLDFTLHGAVPHEAVAEHFGSHEVDVVLNTSISEGVPVSLMEALSAGVPVVATHVGGTGELIHGSNGVLVPEDAEAGQIAVVLRDVADKPGSADARIDFWEQNYSASSNYPPFAQWLASFVSDDP